MASDRPVPYRRIVQVKWGIGRSTLRPTSATGSAMQRNRTIRNSGSEPLPGLRHPNPTPHLPTSLCGVFSLIHSNRRCRGSTPYNPQSQIGGDGAAAITRRVPNPSRPRGVLARVLCSPPPDRTAADAAGRCRPQGLADSFFASHSTLFESARQKKRPRRVSAWKPARTEPPHKAKRPEGNPR